MNSVPRFDRIIVALVLSLIITGCGGGGGGTSASTGNDGPTDNGGNIAPPSAPFLSLSYRPLKTFRFTWNDVDGETEYRLLENPDVVSGYLPLATLSPDTIAYDIPVLLPLRVNARYLLRACNAGGCNESPPVMVDVSKFSALFGYLKASNSGRDDTFGKSVALSADGSTLVVGAVFEMSAARGVGGSQTSNSAPDAGAVYVFVRNDTGTWSQQAYIKASNTGIGDEFGMAVALSADGSTLAVGAPSEASAATGINGDETDNTALEAGAVYVFTRNASGAWSQQAYLKASNTGGGERFGTSLTLSADGATLAVGAPYEGSDANGVGGDQTDDTAPVAGAVYVFTRGTGGTWSQQAYVKASNSDAYDQFGYAVALSGDGATLAVGAYQEDSAAKGINGDETDNTAQNAGAVYVFTRGTGGTWSQQAYVKASNTGASDVFGAAVALSADGATLAVGASDESSAGTGVGGDQTDDTLRGAGAVYVFTRSISGTWSQQAYLKAPSIGADEMGFAVALSADGSILAAGAPAEDGAGTGLYGNPNSDTAMDSGAAYLFTRNSSGEWNYQAYLKATNTDAGDRFGEALALSADGTALAVGAVFEDSAVTGLNGNQNDNTAPDAGAVYLY